MDCLLKPRKVNDFILKNIVAPEWYIFVIRKKTDPDGCGPIVCHLRQCAVTTTFNNLFSMSVLSRIVINEVYTAITIFDWKTSMLGVHLLRRQQVPSCFRLLLSLLLSRTTCATISPVIFPTHCSRCFGLLFCRMYKHGWNVWLTVRKAKGQRLSDKKSNVWYHPCSITATCGAVKTFLERNMCKT